MSQTLQQVISPIDVIKEMCRVSKQDHYISKLWIWRVRFNLFFYGFSPKTKQLPFEWYDTPNIRVITIKDFKKLCLDNNLRIVKEIPLVKRKLQRLFFPLRLTNILTEKGIFIIESK